MLYTEFYSELGKLLYAVADIDGAITQKEKKALQDMVKKDLTTESVFIDKYGTDATNYTEIEFDFLEEEMVDSETAFNSFIGFVDEYKNAIDERMLTFCIHLAEKLADAYKGTNKKEKELIHELRRKLHKLEQDKEK